MEAEFEFEEEEEDPFQASVIRFHLAMTEVQQHQQQHQQRLGMPSQGSEADEARQRAALGRVFEELGAMRAEMYVAGGAADASPAQRAVQGEMLADCERKTGEVMLNFLRRATSAIAPDPEAAPGLFLECVRMKQEAKAANIYGGFLQRRLTESTDAALHALDGVRSLRRLQMGSSNSTAEDADTEAPDQDSQPHVTALNRVLGEASRVIGSLRGDEYYYSSPPGDDDGQQQQQPVDFNHFPSWVSEACLMRMVKALNDLVLKQAAKLLQWYMEDCGVRRWQARCLEQAEDIVVQELDFALDELHLVLGICNRYLAFVGAPREETMDLFIQIQELTGCYVSMEDAYCVINVAKAIALGQPTEVQDGVLVSTIVEDVPMILNRSIERATQTLSNQAILAVANRATELLSPDSVPSFAEALQALVHDRSVDVEDELGGAIDQFSRALEQQLDEEEGNVSHEAMIYAINSMDCAVAAMKKMRDMLLELSRRGGSAHEGGPNMVEGVAHEFGRVLKQYESDLNTLLDDFASRYISSGILELLAEVLGRISYTIDAAVYEKDTAARGDPFVTKFVEHMFVKDKVLRDCRASMTGSALVVFVERVATKLSPALLQALKGKRFSEWGSLKLRQQVRLLQEQLVELIDGKGTLLPQFARLDHMVTLLNLDSPADVHYVMAVHHPGNGQAGDNRGRGGGGTKKEEEEAASRLLTGAEVKQVLKQRVEFDPHVVDALVLK